MSKLIILLYVLATSAALILLKLATKSGPPLRISGGHLSLNLNPYTFLGVTLYGTSFLLYVYLIAKYDLGYIIPLATALVYVLIFLASFIVFKEVFTPIKIIGISLIIIGAILLNLKK